MWFDSFLCPVHLFCFCALNSGIDSEQEWGQQSYMKWKRGKVWRLISVMCRDSSAMMSVAVTTVFYLTHHYLPLAMTNTDRVSFFPPQTSNRNIQNNWYYAVASCLFPTVCWPWMSMPHCGCFRFWVPIHINERDLYSSGSIEVYLNLLNAASKLFSARQANAPALCWHSSNPLEEIASSYAAAQAISEGELKDGEIHITGDWYNMNL